jgi:hypothetical protein
MRNLLLVAAILGLAGLICSKQLPRGTHAAVDCSWNLEHSRSPESIGWPAEAERSDYWTGHRNELSFKHPSGRQLAFANVDFLARRERGQLVSIRLSQHGLTHAQMLQRSRAFCDTWNWPATAARVLYVYPNAASACTAPQIWLAQTRGVSLRISHEGPDRPDTWTVECDFNLRPPP